MVSVTPVAVAAAPAAPNFLLLFILPNTLPVFAGFPNASLAPLGVGLEGG